MNSIIFSRFGMAVLAICAVLTLSSCNKKTDESASTDSSSSPSASNSSAPSTATSSSPASSTTSSGKLGVAPQGTACPSGNPIKAVTSKKLGGKIYLTTKAPNYSKLKPEKCFPDEDTAKNAGYQAPK